MIDKSNELIALARQGDRRTNLILSVVLAGVVIMVSTGAGILLMDRVLFPAGSYQEDQGVAGALWLLLDLTLRFGPVILLLWAWLRIYEHRSLGSLGLRQDKVAPRIFWGLGIGVGIVALCFALMGMLGDVTIDSELTTNSSITASLISALVVAAGIAIQASSEEMLIRGWILQTAALRYGLIAGIFVSILVFTALHFLGGTNTILSAINLLIAGVFYALYALYEGSVVGVCALHAAMNWSEQHLFGYGTSGNIAGGSLFNLEASGADFITGGMVRTGAAGGLPYTIVLLVGVMILLLLFRNKARASQQQHKR